MSEKADEMMRARSSTLDELDRIKDRKQTYDDAIRMLIQRWHRTEQQGTDGTSSPERAD